MARPISVDGIIVLSAIHLNHQADRAGYEIADEPWVKVQHKRGRIGWVYGAGVNYYKKKRGE